MSKRLKIILIVTGILILGGGISTFLYLRSLKLPSRDALEAVPSGAFCIISSNDFQEGWKQLNQGNMIWSALTETEWAAQVNRVAALSDSLISTNDNIGEYLENNPGYLSVHCTGTDQLNYVFTIALPGKSYSGKATEFIRSGTKDYTFTEQKLSNAIIYTGKSASNKFYISECEGIVQISDNEELLRAGIDQLSKGNSLLQDKGFVAVRKTAGEKSVANVYVHYGKLLVLLKRASSKEFHERLDILNTFAGWTETDLNLRPNAVMLNGYTYASDSNAAWLNIFRGQQSQPLEADAVLPSGTIAYTDFCISNFNQFLSGYDNYLSKLGTADERRDRLAQLETNYGYSPEEHIGTWIGNEVVKAEVNIPGEGLKPVAVISTVSTSKTREKLESLRPQRDTGAVTAPLDSTGIPVRSVPVPEMLPATFGEMFSEFRECYYGITSHYVIFANDINTIRSFIISSEFGRTLRKDRNYSDFATNMAKDASLTYYVSASRSSDLITERTENGFTADVKHHQDLLKKFDGVVLQYNIGESNLHYTNVFLRHNPQSKKSVASLWETQLDTTFSGKPSLLINHNTKGLDIFIQDDVNKIYLISSTGSVFWKRQLAEPIMSSIQQVDALKNGKLQIVFNTSDSLYVIDRNGNNLAPFPVKLPDRATNGIKVFDYENNNEYRMLVACADHKVYNFNLKGEKVEGWKLPQTDDDVLAEIGHTIVQNKDYVVIVDRSGKTVITDRQGAIRLTLKEKLGAPVNRFFLEPGKDIARTRIVSTDSLGNVYRLSFNDELERFHFLDFEETPQFEYSDINGDGNMEYLFLSTDKLTVFNQDKLTAMSFGFESPASSWLQTFRFGENDVRIGVICPAANELHLLNKGGAETEGFPLPGQTAYSIGRLNGGSELTVICGINSRYLAAYSMP
jgi:hypothetical protein